MNSRPKTWPCLAAGLALLLGGPTLPVSAAPQTTPPPTGTWVGASVGTLGIGLEARQELSRSISARIGFSTYSLNRTAMVKDVRYHARLRLQTLNAMADLYPAPHGTFHVSIGLMDNRNHVTGDGQPSENSGIPSSFTLNGVTYQTSQVGSLNARLSFPRTAPYLGIGVGRPSGRGVRGFFDLGVLFQGKPHLDLNASINPAVPADVAAMIRQDVAAERDKEQHDLNKYQYYPVVSAGLAYSF